MDFIFNFLSSINWASPSWDVFVYLLFFIGSFLYGFSLGRDRIIVILVSMYMALAIVGNAPVINQLNLAFKVNNNLVLQISFFVGIFVVFFFLLSRSALIRTIGENSAPGKWWQVILFSFLQIGLLISITLSFVPQEALKVFNNTTKTIFIGDIGKSIWLIAPIVLMALSGRRKDD